MPVPVIPALTLEGWDTSPESQISKLFEYYQASDYSQSNSFIGNITSLKYTLKQTRDMLQLSKLIEADIIRLYGDFFDTVEPLVDAKEIQGGIIRVDINIKLTRGVKEYTLTKAIHGKSSGIIGYETKLQDKFQYDHQF